MNEVYAANYFLFSLVGRVMLCLSAPFHSVLYLNDETMFLIRSRTLNTLQETSTANQPDMVNLLPR